VDEPETRAEERIPASEVAPESPPTETARAALPFGSGAKATKILKKSELREPSGLAYHPKRGTLFVVGDRGHVAEVTREGDILNKRRLEHADLEGVTVGPKGLLYAVVEEGPPRILEIDPDTLDVRRDFKVDVKAHGERLVARRANDGLEGLCYVPSERAFFALNQDHPPRIVRLDLPLGSRDAGKKAKIVEIVDIAKGVLEWGSDLAYDARSGHFLVTEAGDGTVEGALHEIDRAGKRVRSVRLPGEFQEGFALDDRGSAFVAYDTGGVVRVDPK
jgi:uncharacterized protein YjiK